VKLSWDFLHFFGPGEEGQALCCTPTPKNRIILLLPQQTTLQQLNHIIKKMFRMKAALENLIE
jgi:hypothetical protein